MKLAHPAVVVAALLGCWAATLHGQKTDVTGANATATAKQNQIEGSDGDGSVAIEGTQAPWHKITLTLSGPFAHEEGNLANSKAPNPFRDYRMEVTFRHEKEASPIKVPGYFAADGNAGQTSASQGNQWRCHFSPPHSGTWKYSVSMVAGKDVAIDSQSPANPVAGCDQRTGQFEIGAPAKGLSDRDFRKHGMLVPNGSHFLNFSGSQRPFYKVGPDAPETLLAYEDFDGTKTLKPEKGPLKTWKPHVKDWSEGDPVWKSGKGKGLIGAMNYLAGKGVNACSFLTYNVDGDGSNVWPHISATEKFNFDCSKLDQWQIVFDHAQSKGLLLHFKLQETENDDHRDRKGKQKVIAGALDGGQLGPQRKLYLRELVARFGYLNAIEWNLGEENTQSTGEQIEMAGYLQEIDPWNHLIVVHTYPDQQDRKYKPLLNQSVLTGASLQNNWDQIHRKTLKWVKASAASGHPWVCANDEQGPANLGVPPDPGYNDFNGIANPGKRRRKYDLHDIRKRTLWGNIMAGGAGVMYYFGYKLPQNDLKAEDFRSRDQSWDYCRIAVDFLESQKLPLEQMRNHNSMVGNPDDNYGPMCYGKPGEVWVVYLPQGGEVSVDLSAEQGDCTAEWFNPRTGGELVPVEINQQNAATRFVSPLGEKEDDWVLLIRRQK